MQANITRGNSVMENYQPAISESDPKPKPAPKGLIDYSNYPAIGSKTS